LTVVLIACCAQKLATTAPAAVLYCSPLFHKSLAYARTQTTDDHIFILSAKYGLVPLAQEIEPYEVTLLTMPLPLVHAWADRVLSQLRLVADVERDRFVLLAGARYRQFLVPRLRSVSVPMAGLGIGQQLHWLSTPRLA